MVVYLQAGDKLWRLREVRELLAATSTVRIKIRMLNAERNMLRNMYTHALKHAPAMLAMPRPRSSCVLSSL